MIANALTFGTLNLNGARDKMKRLTLIDFINFKKIRDDLNVLQSIVNYFIFLSSAKVNWGKSEVIWVGELEKRCTGLSCGLVWIKEMFKYSGVYLSDDVFVQKNWEGVLVKVKFLLGKWKWLLPQLLLLYLLYKFACMEPPVGLIDSIQREVVLLQVLWPGDHWLLAFCVKSVTWAWTLLFSQMDTKQFALDGLSP